MLELAQSEESELLAQGYEIWAVVRDYHSDVSFIINSSVNLVFCDLKKIEDLVQETMRELIFQKENTYYF